METYYLWAMYLKMDMEVDFMVYIFTTYKTSKSFDLICLPLACFFTGLGYRDLAALAPVRIIFPRFVLRNGLVL